MKPYLYPFLLIFLLSSCSSSGSIEEVELIDYDALNETEIQNYLSQNNLNPQKSSSGLYYIITDEGIGNTPTILSNVKVDFKGYNTSGVIFEESPDEGIDFNLNDLIIGFSEGVTYLKENGKATLIIPSKIGYPPNLRSSHPLGGKVIIFDVKLIKIN
jgi:FKBP-type peptidyl-prolyl cis-trans isomerase FkpA